MKKIQKPNKKTYETIADRDDACRLEDLECFERIHFDRWLVYMAELSKLSPSDILAVIHWSVSNGFAQAEGSPAFDDRLCARVFHTPLEIACAFFIEDHWRPGKPLPSRDITYHPERARYRAKVFTSTHKISKITHIFHKNPDDQLTPEQKKRRERYEASKRPKG